MQKGDIVRFAKWEEIVGDHLNSKKWPEAPKNHIGILIEHDKLMGSVHILYQGEVLKVRPVFVEKSGKKDIRKNNDQN